MISDIVLRYFPNCDPTKHPGAFQIQEARMSELSEQPQLAGLARRESQGTNHNQLSGLVQSYLCHPGSS